MASWYSSLVTKTSSQISSLRATLLASEADGDTEDDTHVCRVLRNYYTDKGRPLPPWLPPDPKAPAVAQPLYAQQSSSLVGSRYGAASQPNLGASLPQGQQQGQQSTGGGLSSLWDAGPSPAAGPQHPQSLRSGSRTPQPRSARDNVAARPLPSQRAGSYQGTASAAAVPPAAAAAGATPSPGPAASAQDRLRQRLRAGPSSRTSSPANAAATAQGPYNPPTAAAAPAMQQSSSRQGLPAGPRRQGMPPPGANKGYR